MHLLKELAGIVAVEFDFRENPVGARSPIDDVLSDRKLLFEMINRAVLFGKAKLSAALQHTSQDLFLRHDRHYLGLSMTIPIRNSFGRQIPLRLLEQRKRAGVVRRRVQRIADLLA